MRSIFLRSTFIRATLLKSILNYGQGNNTECNKTDTYIHRVYSPVWYLMAAKYSSRVMSPALKRSKRVWILFSFSFIRLLQDRAVAPELKFWIFALDTVSSCWIYSIHEKMFGWGLLMTFFILECHPSNVIVRSWLMLVEVVSMYWGEIAIDPGSCEIVDQFINSRDIGSVLLSGKPGCPDICL